MLREYFISLMTNENGRLELPTRTAAGMLIVSMVRRCLRPSRKQSDDVVVVYVPHTQFSESCRFKHGVLSTEAERMFVEMLRREFDVAFHSFVNSGVMLGFKRKILIEMFIEQHNLGDVRTSFDTLAKKRYRLKLRTLKIMGNRAQKQQKNRSRTKNSDI